MSELNDWLDTQTKAELLASPPKKLAPPVVAGYSLVVLDRGANRERVDRTLRSLVDWPARSPTQCPFVVRRGLSLTVALEGQFELICADCVSVFINDEVVRGAPARYLQDLYKMLRKSPEFQPVSVSVHSVPQDAHGVRFLEQFFGHVPKLPVTQLVARKKARIMRHWGNKVGAVIDCDPSDPS